MLLAGPDGHVQETGNGAPGLAAEAGAARALTAIMDVAAPMLRLARVPGIDAVCVGAAGMLAAPEAARTLARLLREKLDATSVCVTSDAITSHAGALGGRAGVVLAAGTGAVAIGVGDDGQMTRADGWGPRLGDEGGGAWMGLQGLRACLRALDGRGPATVLSAAAISRYGPIAGLVATIEGHPNPPQCAATFAQDVYRAAADGCSVGRDILDRAAASLAETVMAAAAPLTQHLDTARPLTPRPLAFASVGGLLALGPLLTDRLHAILQSHLPSLVAVPAQGTALDGALLLATNTRTVHEATLVREGRSDVALVPAATNQNTSNREVSDTP